MGSCLSAESRSPLPSSPSASLGVSRRRKNPKRRLGSRTSSFDSRKDELLQLHKIPGRMFLNGASDFASLFTQQGKKGTNQDAMIVWEVSSLLSFQVTLYPFQMMKCPQLYFSHGLYKIICSTYCCYCSCCRIVMRSHQPLDVLRVLVLMRLPAHSMTVFAY